jgi:hypothetical protein
VPAQAQPGCNAVVLLMDENTCTSTLTAFASYCP